MQRTRTPAVVALLTIGAALAVAVAAELGRPGGADPIGPTFSELIFTELGARLVGISMILLAAGSLAAVLALSLAGVQDRLAWALTGLWSAGLTIAAIFPMEPVGVALTWHGAIHRYAALAGFVTLPLAGFRLGGRLGEGCSSGRSGGSGRGGARLPALLSAAGLLGVAVFAGTFVIGGRAFSGVAERLLLGVDILLLVTLTSHALTRQGACRSDR